MKTFLILISSLILWLFSGDTKTRHKSKLYTGFITVKFKLRPNENATLLTDDSTGDDKKIIFFNTGTTDTIISQQIASNKPKEFRYGRGNKNGRFIHHFLLDPNTVTTFEMVNGIDIQPLNTDKKALFLDYWFGFKYNYIHHKLSNENDYKIYFSKVDKFNIKNLKLIDSLYGVKIIDIKTKNNWEAYKAIEYNTAYMYFFKKNNFNSITQKYKIRADSILNNYGRDVSKVDFSNELFYYLCNYGLLKDNKNIDNINDRILYLIRNEQKFGYEIVINEAYSLIKNYSKVSDPNYKLAYNNLLEFASAKRNGKYEGLIKQINQNDFSSYAEVKLINIQNEQTTLKDIANESNKFILIDLWASWCKPCRQQIPFLEQYKLKNKSTVRIISINIDDEDKPQLWINALKEEAIYNSKDQYQLKNKETSPLLKFFNVISIPRYIILDNKGKVINSFFYTPDDQRFEKELNNLSDQKK
ncbi:TlpA disulfide reductase family protein [Pedobacter nototheniae]|uniref:TlpA family protein disulfide reductase n=1 Tax=Pedobacter nototheniae TaxID=2488994 RepID=UPI00292F16E9|nr:TlpA disulfide reductase family protein [Pedobacter nototheniae]